MSTSNSDSDIERSNDEGVAIRPRIFRARPVLDDPNEFRMRFRLTPRQRDILLNLLGPDLQPSTLRSNPLSAKEKLLCALRFYASNTFNYTTGDAQGPSRESVRRAIREVTSLINVKLSDRIKWPDNQDACRRIASNFFSLARPGMPAVCGAVDGTLVKLAFCPNEHESQFVDRHQQHSINAMGVAGPDYRFYFLSAKWPGSVNDARVLRNSAMAANFNGGNFNLSKCCPSWRLYLRGFRLVGANASTCESTIQCFLQVSCQDEKDCGVCLRVV